MSNNQIRYHLSFPQPHTHYVKVNLHVTGIEQQQVALTMPVWTPGSYLLREYPQHVESVSARNGEGVKLSVAKVNKHTWHIKKAPAEELVFTYHVYAFDYTVRTSLVDADHASLTPASIFMIPAGYENQRLEVVFSPDPSWNKVTTALPMINNDPLKRQAQNFDELVDAPMEIGNHHQFSFEAASTHHEVAMIGEAQYDEQQLKKDMARMVETVTKVFGENPCTEYTFLIHHTHDKGGGLEHMNSTAIMIPRQFYLEQDKYKVLLRLIAHEYFHLWNVKRLRPAPFAQFDYSRENYTDLLWVAEGITSYYDELILQRTGHYSTQEYLDKLAETITEVCNTPGAQVQTVAESSFDAWIKHYRRNENTANADISYYQKGAVIAACLDVLIIKGTNAQRSLDDVLLLLYETHVNDYIGEYTRADVEAALEEVSGQSFHSFIEKHVYGTDPIPLESIFADMGVEIANKPAQDEAWLGAVLKESNGKLLVKEVRKGGSAWHGGLNVGDEIIATDNMRADKELLEKILDNTRPGDVLSITVSRSGILRELKVKLKEDGRYNFTLQEKEEKTDREAQNFKRWIKQ